MAGALIYVLHHFAEGAGDDMGDDTDEAVSRLRCAPSGRRSGEITMGLAGQQKVPALALLRLLRGGTL